MVDDDLKGFVYSFYADSREVGPIIRRLRERKGRDEISSVGQFIRDAIVEKVNRERR